MADNKELASLSSSLSKLSGSLRGISTNKDFHFYNNFDAFKHPVTQISSTSQLMLDAIAANSSQLFGKELELDDDDDNAYDWLVNVNDEVFERFDFAIDEFENVRKSGEVVTLRAENGGGESLGFSEVKVAKKDEKVLGAKPKIPFHIPSIVKPQKQYRILVNNSKEPFQHVWLQRSEDGSRFIHPLEKFSPMDFVDKNVSTVEPVKPLPVDFTTYTFVDSVDDLKELAAKLRCADEFAVDLEHNQYRSYQGLTCLMQISTRTEDFVVDTLKLRIHIGPHLRELFKDPSKKKVMHGADRDIMWLQRDFGIYVCNMFDTGQASRVLKLERNSLEYLLNHYCEVAANKEYQNADWRLRPLTDDMLRYAREDTHYLLYIYDVMKIELLSLSTESESTDASLVEVYQRSYDICMQLYEKDVLTDSTILHIYGIQSADLNAQQLAVAAGLSEWRDVVARAEDESTGFILPNKTLLEIAKQMPTTTSMLRRAVKSRHHYIDRNLGSVVSIIRTSMQNAAAYETIAEKLKEDRKKAISDGKSVGADGSEALSHPAVLDTTDSVQHENILDLAPSTSEMERNEPEGSSGHARDDLNPQNDKDGCIPAHQKSNFTMSQQIREGSGTEVTVQVLKKPSRGFGALLGNSASKRKYDSEKVESKEAKLEQIKSSVNLPFHAFSGKVETLEPVKEPAKPPQSLCHKEPVALSAANSQMQDILVIDDGSDDEMFNDDPKSADDKLEQTEGKPPADILTNSRSDVELLDDDNPKSMDKKSEQTEGNAVLSNKSPVLDIIMLDDDSDEETVKDNPKSTSDELPEDKVSTPLSSNENDETMSLSDLSSGHLQTANGTGKTKLVKNSQEQEPLQIKPFDYEAARKEVRFGEDRRRNGGDEGGKNKRDTGNRKKNAAKGQSEGNEESGGFQLGRRRQAFPVTGNRSATFR
ncbi:3'-5' exonuclease domain-containing family protein [Heracleum sosnowskyi]|uniref:3'-5' exonuclease domain-containing family protein n=1 Tax=Heracleum sosnowskyi TaxID=360622 RepID=A0AAD8JHE6_9APIA|nr:3'-5' exonuclease domain-containing family protein [Heracleum sosnowskyi]